MENVDDVTVDTVTRKELIEEKPWGISEKIFWNSVTQLYRIEVVKGGKSSYGNFHKHRTRYNLIYVEVGQLKLYVNTYKEQKEIILDPDTKRVRYTIYPNIFHRFEAVTDVVAYELYYTFCDFEDTYRENN